MSDPIADLRPGDRKIPTWWTALTVLTLLGSGLHLLVFRADLLVHGRGAPERVRDQLQTIQARKDSLDALRPAFPYDEVSALPEDPDRLAEGQNLYLANCQTCHGPDGRGSIGPDLTDGTWIHGGRVDSVAQTILDGVAAKGMPAWGNRFEREQIASLAAFVTGALAGHRAASP